MRCLALLLAAALPACGGSIAAIDGLPDIAVDESAPYPRLVDVPEPPEARLTAGTGEVVLARLNESADDAATRREAAIRATAVLPDLGPAGSEARARAATPPEPIDDTLLARAAQARARPPAPPVDDALLARARAVRARAATPAAPIDERLLERRPRPAPPEPVAAAPRPAPTTQASTPARRPAPVPPRTGDVLEDGFERKAREALERARRQGS